MILSSFPYTLCRQICTITDVIYTSWNSCYNYKGKCEQQKENYTHTQRNETEADIFFVK